MAWTLTVAYAAIAVVVAIVVFVMAAKLGDGRRPMAQRIGLSAVAGVVWPVILLGVVEVTSFAAYAKVHEHDDDQAKVSVVV